MVLNSPFFKALVELERSSLSPRSKKLFTLSAIYNANSALLDKLDIESRENSVVIATQWWEAVAEHIPEWNQVYEHKVSAGEVRQRYIHTHGTTLVALARVGNAILKNGSAPVIQSGWKSRIKPLSKIDWSRSNREWVGRTIINGQVKKGDQNIRLTANVIKRRLKLPLGPEEERAEEQFSANHRRRKKQG